MDRLYFCNPEMNCLEKSELQPFKDLGSSQRVSTSVQYEAVSCSKLGAIQHTGYL